MPDLDRPEAVEDLKVGIRALDRLAAIAVRMEASEAMLGNADRAEEYRDRARALRVCMDALQDLIDG